MIILADSRMPTAALEQLQAMGTLVGLLPMTEVYQAIASHPDIFFCPTPSGLVYAPELPYPIIQLLDQAGVPLIKGVKQPQSQYPFTSHYNAVATETLLLHNLSYTDPAIKELYPSSQQIHLNQGYTRCNLLPVAPNAFITSDKACFNTLKRSGMEVFLCSTKSVRLAGFRHGFFPGCCGILQDIIYVCGNPRLLPDHKPLTEFCGHYGKQLIALYDGPLLDVGSIFFLDAFSCDQL